MEQTSVSKRDTGSIPTREDVEHHLPGTGTKHFNVIPVHHTRNSRPLDENLAGVQWTGGQRMNIVAKRPDRPKGLGAGVRSGQQHKNRGDGGKFRHGSIPALELPQVR